MTRKVKNLEGTVVSAKMMKTRVVRVVRQTAHPLFGKGIRPVSKFLVHDEANAAKTGDRVVFSECRPLSRRKRWRIIKIMKAGGEV